MEKRMQVFPGVGCLRGSRGVNIGATLRGLHRDLYGDPLPDLPLSTSKAGAL